MLERSNAKMFERFSAPLLACFLQTLLVVVSKLLSTIVDFIVTFYDCPMDVVQYHVLPCAWCHFYAEPPQKPESDLVSERPGDVKSLTSFACVLHPWHY